MSNLPPADTYEHDTPDDIAFERAVSALNASVVLGRIQERMQLALPTTRQIDPTIDVQLFTRGPLRSPNGTVLHGDVYRLLLRPEVAGLVWDAEGCTVSAVVVHVPNLADEPDLAVPAVGLAYVDVVGSGDNWYRYAVTGEGVFDVPDDDLVQDQDGGFVRVYDPEDVEVVRRSIGLAQSLQYFLNPTVSLLANQPKTRSDSDPGSAAA